MSTSVPTLNLFDVDYTLFRTSSNILVRKGDDVVKVLTSTEYNTNRLLEGEVYDFSEFKNAANFYATSIPIPPMIRKIRDVIAHHLPRNPFNKVVISTARSTFDDTALFQKKFVEQKINIDRCEFCFAGDTHIQPTWVAKTMCALKLLADPNIYGKARLWDDADDNLKGFLKLQVFFPRTKFEAFKVSPEGITSVFNL